MTVKKTIVAIALTVPLAFVAACGSGESAESTPTPSTVTSTSSATTSSTEPTSSEEETTPETQTEPETEPEPEPQAQDQPGDPLLAELGEEPEPVHGGHAATDAERAEIEQLVHGIYQVDTFHQLLRYIPDNTCHEVLAAQGGAQAMDLSDIPDQPLSQMPQYANANPHIESVTDVQVDGNRASAVVTAVSGGNTETRTQRYLHEDGRWKFCA